MVYHIVSLVNTFYSFFDTFLTIYSNDDNIGSGSDILNNLRKLREKRGLSLRDLGKKLNIGYQAIGRMERGESLINDVDAKTFADFFGVSLDYLFMREQDIPTKTVYKTNEITYELVLSKLHTFSNQELVRIIGAAEGTLQARDGLINGQLSVKPSADLFKKSQS